MNAPFLSRVLAIPPKRANDPAGVRWFYDPTARVVCFPQRKRHGSRNWLLKSVCHSEMALLLPPPRFDAGSRTPKAISS